MSYTFTITILGIIVILEACIILALALAYRPYIQEQKKINMSYQRTEPKPIVYRKEGQG